MLSYSKCALATFVALTFFHARTTLAELNESSVDKPVEVSCTTNGDCGDSQQCARSEARPYADLICCSAGDTSQGASSTVRVCRFPDWDPVQMECFVVCKNRAAGSACEGENSVCASGVCGMDDRCTDEKFVDESPCRDDDQCESGVCAKSESVVGAELVCCSNGDAGFDSSHGTVCAERPAGAACSGNNDLCASGVCGLDDLCKDEVPGVCIGVPADCGEVHVTTFGTLFNGTCNSPQDTWHCENRSGCQCGDESGENSKVCIGAPVACEEHFDVASCRSQGGCTWVAYNPGVCVDAACGPLYRPAGCSRYTDSNYNPIDSCNTYEDKCEPSCSGRREGCACSTYNYDCELKEKFGLTQNVCEGTIVCDHVETPCRAAQSRTECLALGEEGLGCDWMMLWRDWEDDSVTASSGKKEEQDSNKTTSTVPPGTAPAADNTHLSSPGSMYLPLKEIFMLGISLTAFLVDM